MAIARTRDGELVDPEAVATNPADAHMCQDGWRGEDARGRPRPCFICRPHLARTTSSAWTVRREKVGARA